MFPSNSRWECYHGKTANWKFVDVVSFDTLSLRKLNPQANTSPRETTGHFVGCSMISLFQPTLRLSRLSRDGSAVMVQKRLRTFVDIVSLR